MANPVFQKAACTLCGGKIEFPATAEGMTVECPHCHGQTELRPVEKAARSIRSLIIFTVLGIALAGGVLFLLKPKSQPADAGPPSPVLSSNAAPAPSTPLRPKSTADLKLLGNVTLEKAPGGRLTYAMGTVRNDSDHQRYGVRVEIDLFDQAGNKLATQANDYLQNLEPRKEWKFRALVVDTKASNARLAAVKEEE